MTVATTRPETFVGDVAVAVNPKDERYTTGRPHGDAAGDPARDPGASPTRRSRWSSAPAPLKVTPGHDPTDFEIGQRHDLPIINAMNLDATMNAAGGAVRRHGPLRGARRRSCATSKSWATSRRRSRTRCTIGVCSRCHTVVEPLMSWQWFVNMKPLAQPGIDVVRDGRDHVRAGPLRAHLPELDGEHPRLVHLAPALVGPPHPRLVQRRRRRRPDHRHAARPGAPAKRRRASARTTSCARRASRTRRSPRTAPGPASRRRRSSSIETPERSPTGGGHLLQENDVLDTWFSSGLWPFSTLGWPHDERRAARTGTRRR